MIDWWPKIFPMVNLSECRSWNKLSNGLWITSIGVTVWKLWPKQPEQHIICLGAIRSQWVRPAPKSCDGKQTEVISSECDPHSVRTTRSQVGRKDASIGFSGRIAEKSPRTTRTHPLRSVPSKWMVQISNSQTTYLGTTRTYRVRPVPKLAEARPFSSAPKHIFSPENILPPFPSIFQGFSMVSKPFLA